jgi:ribonuclease HI/probable phosphoglycerate mutase
MANNGLGRTALVKILAEKLPDSIFRDLFPDVPAKAVRDVLQGKKKTALPEPRQHSLFSEPAVDKGLGCKLFTDGASRGNPGEAGAGIVLLDDSDRELAVRSSYLGRCTNNVAEYQALLLGLKTARELGCRSLVIFMDSQLIVRQVQGRYRVKSTDLKPLYDQVKNFLADLDGWSITHVLRAENKRADEMANRGIDEKK